MVLNTTGLELGRWWVGKEEEEEEGTGTREGEFEVCGEEGGRSH